MKTVWKFPLSFASIVSSQTVGMPAGAEIVHFDLVGNVPTIWALVDPRGYDPADRPGHEQRTFTVYGTGADIPDYGTHVGTWRQADLVWHLFEVT